MSKPHEPLGSLTEEVGRLLTQLRTHASWSWVNAFPPVNLLETTDQFVLVAELAGMLPEDLELSITGDVLFLGGERKRPDGIGEESYRRRERPVGRWQRSISLPAPVDPARITADFQNGLLTVRMPKAEQLRPRRIGVTGAAT